MFSGVLGPKRRRFIIDDHHLARALIEEQVQLVLFNVLADLSELDKREFWTVMDYRNLVHAYDSAGRKHPYRDLPKSVSGLADDPYRSLAAAVHMAGGFPNEEAAFVKFLPESVQRQRRRHNPTVAGDVPLRSMVDLLRTLVRIPSRAGDDDLDNVCLTVEDWFRVRRVPIRELTAPSGQRLGLYAEVPGKMGRGPWTILNATLDTAAFGNPTTWTMDPTGAEIADGWLFGRGSADSKAAVSLFAHLLLELVENPAYAGRVGVLFDCDEHSGHFGGAHAFFDHPYDGDGEPRPDGVLIGYPGMDRIVNGCRGFLRSRFVVHGVSGHSGASQNRGINAISRALDLGRRLESLVLAPATEAFPLTPQLTITGIQGGAQTFTQVPDLCEIRLDVRLTPSFALETARRTIEAVVASFDNESPQTLASETEWLGGWPPYQLSSSHRLVMAMRGASRDELGVEVPTAVVGPSNIGNYLASLGVPALCGFGVKAEGIHAADERVALDSIDPVYRVYRNALARLHRL